MHVVRGSSSHPPHVTVEARLGDLATTWAGASRVFHRHGLDFCCNGTRTVGQACAAKGLDPDRVVAELREAIATTDQEVDWRRRSTRELVEHLLTRYHEGHRAELPRLIRMAAKVEAVHGDKPECPRGLTTFLQQLDAELAAHMQKEEQVLFPLLLDGDTAHARMPIAVMEREHDQHGRNLAWLRQVARDFSPPTAACGTWRALYLGLTELESELMQHIALENHVLFPRAVGS